MPYLSPGWDDTIRAELEAAVECTLEYGQSNRQPVEALPADRSTWSDDADNTYREVLRELDRWCRDTGSSGILNSWVAEEAVRQTW